MASNKATTKGTKTESRQGLYAYASTYSRQAIEVLAEMMLNAKNEGVRMGAAKALLDKALPDIKATEISTGDNGPLEIRIISEDKAVKTEDSLEWTIDNDTTGSQEL